MYWGLTEVNHYTQQDRSSITNDSYHQHHHRGNLHPHPQTAALIAMVNEMLYDDDNDYNDDKDDDDGN